MSWSRRVGEVVDLADVDRQLVQQDQGRLTAEQLPDGLGTRCRNQLVRLANPFVARLPGERVRDLAPRRPGIHVFAHVSPVGRVGVLAIEGGNPDLALRDQLGVDELGDVGHSLHAARRVEQGDQGVRLAAAVGRVQPEDRRHLAAGAGQAGADVGQQVLEATRGVGVGEELRRYPVLSGAILATDHLRKVGRKVGLGDGPFQHIVARCTQIKDRRHSHFPLIQAETILGLNRLTE